MASPSLIPSGDFRTTYAADTTIRFQDGTTQRIRTTLKVVDLAHEAHVAEAAE